MGKPPAWTVQGYQEAVEASVLKPKVKCTLQAMVSHAGAQYTAIDRATLLQLTGGQREATVTAHWSEARLHGLMVSKQRFNATSIHKFTIPGIDDTSVDDLALARPLKFHVWTPEELRWWQGLRDDSPALPPWLDGPPPF